MHKSARLLFFVLILVSPLGSLRTEAAPLDIKSGLIQMEGPQNFNLFLSGRNVTFQGGGESSQQASFAPGQTVNLSRTLIPEFLSFFEVAEVDGVSYGDASFIAYNLNLRSSSFELPLDFETSDLSFSRPFTFDGTISGFENSNGSGTPLFSVDLRGAGIATLTLVLSEPDEAILLSYDYSFQPVPEPATMLLLGTGLVGVVGAARRRKNKRDNGA